MNVSDTGLVYAFAEGPDVSATSIGVVAAETTIHIVQGRSGLAFGRWGSTIHRGTAIDTISIAGLIELQGTGHIYGDMNIASGNTIEVTGKDLFRRHHQRGRRHPRYL